MPTNFIYGNVTLSDNKTDGGQATSTTKIVASEWNTSVDALYDTKAAITAGQYHGLTNMASSLPAVAGSGEVRLVSNAGVAMLSENGRAFAPLRPQFDVKAYGALGNATADDTAAIQNAINAAQLVGGGTVVFPEGVYRVTGQLLVGYRSVTESDITSAEAEPSGYASYDATNYGLAGSAPPVNLKGLGGAVIFGDWAPGNERAIIYYGVRSKGDARADAFSGEISDLTLAGPGTYSGGVLQNPGGTVTTNVSGVCAVTSKVRLVNITCREVKRGFVLNSCFWSMIEGCTVRHCVDGFVLSLHSAATVRDVLVESASGTAVAISGQGLSVEGIWTEDCAVDLYVPSCDQARIARGYFEDTNSAHTDYGIKLGDGTSGIYQFEMQNVHQSRQYGKQALLKLAQTKFTTCRFYENLAGTGYFTINDLGCGVIADHCSFHLDPAGSNAAYMERSFNKVAARQRMEIGESTPATGGLRINAFEIWGDTVNGVIRAKYGTPTALWDGKALGSDYINVKEYGAQGDGTTDDTVAIQAALTYAQNHTCVVYFPNGTYKITSTLTYSPGNGFACRFVGDVGGAYGTFGSKLKWTGASGGKLWLASNVSGCEWENLNFDGNDLAADLLQITIYSSTNYIRRCTFQSIRNSGTSSCLHLADGSGGQVSEIFVQDSVFRPRLSGTAGATVYGVFIDGAANTKNFGFERCSFNFVGVAIAGASSGFLTVKECSFGDASGTANITCGSTQATMINCALEGSGANQPPWVYSGDLGTNSGSLQMMNCYAVAPFAATDIALYFTGSLRLVGNLFRNTRTTTALSKIVTQCSTTIEAGSVISEGNNYDHSTTVAPLYDTSGNELLEGFYSTTIEHKIHSFGDSGLSDGGALSILRPTTGQAYEMTRARVRTTASATGITPVISGAPRRAWHKVTVDYRAFQTAALFQDINLFELNPGTAIVGLVLDVTAAFAGTAGTLQLQAGSTTGGAEYVVASDVKSAPVTLGLADADFGGGAGVLQRANLVQGHYFPVWAPGGSTSFLRLRLTSSVGNLSGLTVGTVTVTLVTEMWA